MQGLVIFNDKKYIFRDDDAYLAPKEIRAWDVYSESHRASSEKWQSFPKDSIIITFDLDNPPKTVSYLPINNNY